MGSSTGGLDRAKGTFAAVEGNTSFTDDANGGEVVLRDDRSRAPVVAFVNVVS